MFDWSELAFKSKKPLRELKATFIAAPRELSIRRFTQLVKQYLPKGNIVLGIAKEVYIDSFEGQPQFKTLKVETVQPVIDKVNHSPSKYKIYALHYFQRELPFIIEKVGCKQAVLINGSWHRSFHTRPEFYTLVQQNIPYKLLSPFSDEVEARDYAKQIEPDLPESEGILNKKEMLAVVDQAATCSFDSSFQTGVALGRKKGKKYELLAATCNNVVPFQTYAMHYGASREINFSPPNDLNHYDAVHAEVALMIKAQKLGLDLHDTTLFINLLPCPTCARMFTETDIAEFVYKQDHSAGYAIKLLEFSGKRVQRFIP